jgi:hypothetical protein
MTKKECNKCNDVLDLNLFPKSNRLLDGYLNSCKKCMAEYKKNHYQKDKQNYIDRSKIWKSENKNKVVESGKKYRLKNKEKEYLRGKNWQQSNKEKVVLKSRKWQINNKELFRKSRKKYIDNRLKNDPVFFVSQKIRKTISDSIRRSKFTKNSKSGKILGCDWLFFKNHIERQFKDGMNWNNIHLDHIIPISSAKTEFEILKLNHYTNFQPLFPIDNIRKSNKIT